MLHLLRRHAQMVAPVRVVRALQVRLPFHALVHLTSDALSLWLGSWRQQLQGLWSFNLVALLCSLVDFVVP